MDRDVEKKLEKKLEAIEEMLRLLLSRRTDTTPILALKKPAAAKAMGISPTKLKELIRLGVIQTVRHPPSPGAKKSHAVIQMTEIDLYLSRYRDGGSRKRDPSAEKPGRKKRSVETPYNASAEAEELRAQLRKKRR